MTPPPLKTTFACRVGGHASRAGPHARTPDLHRYVRLTLVGFEPRADTDGDRMTTVREALEHLCPQGMRLLGEVTREQPNEALQ